MTRIRTFMLNYEVDKTNDDKNEIFYIDNNLIVDENGNIINNQDCAVISDKKLIGKLFDPYYEIYELSNVRPFNNKIPENNL